LISSGLVIAGVLLLFTLKRVQKRPVSPESALEGTS
jgi:hypothetical protein